MSRPSLLARLRSMNHRSLFGTTDRTDTGPISQAQADEVVAPVNRARAEAMQRLQIGLLGIGAMVLLVGLASIIGSQADLADLEAVPEAAPTTEPTDTPTPANPLADAGVVPDIAADPSPSPVPGPLDLPPPGSPDPRDASPSR